MAGEILSFGISIFLFLVGLGWCFRLASHVGVSDEKIQQSLNKTIQSLSDEDFNSIIEELNRIRNEGEKEC